MSKKESLDLSVIVPFKDKASMTLDCINSLFRYGPIVKEILLISNNSSKNQLKIVKEFAENHKHTAISVHEYNRPFNYQEINNWAVGKSTASTILFLNNDTELTKESQGLVERMYQKAQESSVGAVGCLLLYGNERTIQHAGVYLVPGGLAEHLYVGRSCRAVLQQAGKSKNYPYDIKEDRPLTAVTGAVCMVRRKKFLSVGGFDERFIIGGGDVDLCIRLNKAGYQTWYVAGPEHILHKEKRSRVGIATPFNDAFWSYLSYIKAYNYKKGDPFLSKLAKRSS